MATATLCSQKVVMLTLPGGMPSNALTTEVTSTSSRIWRKPMVLTARSMVSILVGKL